MMAEDNLLSVSALTRLIKSNLESSFSSVSLVGEISNYKDHYSGHWYFTLKDADAQISCAMWKSNNSRVVFKPQDGMRVIVKGRITVWPPRGNYQIDVRSMIAAGEGELQLAFERLKAKLVKEGLFDEAKKKPLPAFPEKIGIVTSITGAAVRDMVSVARRRFPLLELVVAPAKVQGAGGAESIAEGIADLDKRGDIDVIIIGRGGGSIEDLWPFNEEVTARAIHAAQTPVVSGVGHEIDFTIADFVADVRAATPTAAMELVTPDMREYMARVESFVEVSGTELQERIADYHNVVDRFLTSRGLSIPLDMIRNYQQQLDHLIYKTGNSVANTMNRTKGRLALLEQTVKGHDVQTTLRRGFAYVKQDGRFVTRKSQLGANAPVDLYFYDGEVKGLKTDE